MRTYLRRLRGWPSSPLTRRVFASRGKVRIPVARAIGLFDVDRILEPDRYRAALEPWYKEQVLRRSGG